MSANAPSIDEQFPDGMPSSDAAPPPAAPRTISPFQHPLFDEGFNRVVSNTTRGFAAFREIEEGIGRVERLEPAAWVDAFSGLGDRVRARAERIFAGGHLISARQAFFTAGHYYRSAEYFAVVGSAEFKSTWEGSRACFDQAYALMSPPVEHLVIPFEGIELPAMLLRPSGFEGQRPTVVILSGFDGAMDESPTMMGNGALERGYNVVLVEGPGHYDVNHRYGTPYRPDFEVPMAVILDTILAHPLIDPARVALIGMSFGGHLALRITAFEHRFRAVIACNPITDFGVWADRTWPPPLKALLAKNPADVTDDEIAAVDAIYNGDPLYHWLKSWLCNKMGETTMFATAKRFSDYAIDADTLSNIKTPLLGLVSRGEGPAALAQAELARASVAGPADLYIFEAEESAVHCQLDNGPLRDQVAFDWLDPLMV